MTRDPKRLFQSSERMDKVTSGHYAGSGDFIGCWAIIQK